MRHHHAYVIHHIAGRMRLHVPRAKGNASALQEIRDFVAAIPGVSRVEFNPITGTVLMHYDHAAQPDFHAELKQRAESLDLFSLLPETDMAEKAVEVVKHDADLLAQHSAAAKAIVEFFDKLDVRIKRATNNAVGLRVLLLIGVAGYSIFRSIRDKAGGSGWIILFLFALDSFIRMHEPRPTPSAQSASPAWPSGAVH